MAEDKRPNLYLDPGKHGIIDYMGRRFRDLGFDCNDRESVIALSNNLAYHIPSSIDPEKIKDSEESNLVRIAKQGD